MTYKKEIKVKLTEDPLENIKIMAPLLSKREQENVFVYVMGLYNGAMGREENRTENSSEQKGA